MINPVWVIGLCFCLASFFAAEIATAQRHEITGQADHARSRPAKAAKPNNLAKCLADPDDRKHCYLARTEATDGGLENHVQGQLGASSFAECAAPGGVCLEIATYDPGPGHKRGQSQAHNRLKSVDFSITFRFDTSDVDETGARQIKQLAAAINHQENADARFVVIGHTDTKGSYTYNCELSQLRAQSVSKLLVKSGVALSRLQVVGAGEHLPVDAANGEGAANWRVGFARLRDDGADIVKRIANRCATAN